MNSDAELLSQFVEQASEEAFTELVSRHLDLVFCAALRQVGGDRHLAQDVAQSVFTALARKARSLPAQVTLAGWLYRHACFAARQAVRAECRRRRREQEAAAMNSPQATTEPGWEHLAPTVDLAMQRLRAVERDALILRYFENRDLRSMADALGTSEEAAKKRVARALQKLRVFFQRRGFTLSDVTLSNWLASKAVTAAPAGLKTTIASTACASSAASGGGFLFLQTMSTKKVAVIVAASLGLIGLVGLLVTHAPSTSSRSVAIRVSHGTHYVYLQPVECLTRDNKMLRLSMNVSWHVADARAFAKSFPGNSITLAQRHLNRMIYSSSAEVVGLHNLSEFVNPDGSEATRGVIEKTLQTSIEGKLDENIGIVIESVDIHSVTQR